MQEPGKRGKKVAVGAAFAAPARVPASVASQHLLRSPFAEDGHCDKDLLGAAGRAGQDKTSPGGLLSFRTYISPYTYESQNLHPLNITSGVHAANSVSVHADGMPVITDALYRAKRHNPNPLSAYFCILGIPTDTVWVFFLEPETSSSSAGHPGYDPQNLPLAMLLAKVPHQGRSLMESPFVLHDHRGLGANADPLP